MDLLHLLEPEEFIGELWHRLVGDRSCIAHFPDAGVDFGEVAPRLRVFFHGLGGAASAELKAAMPEASYHRLGLRRAIGKQSERTPRARFDGERFLLPDRLDLLPTRRLNEQLYFWLAAWTVAADEIAVALPDDPFAADLAQIAQAIAATEVALTRFPGLAKMHAELARAALAVRTVRSLPAAEAEAERQISAHLVAAAGDPVPASRAPPISPPAAADYRPYLPNPLWGEIDEAFERAPSPKGRDDCDSAGNSSQGSDSSRRATRKKADRIEKKGGLIVHRFEKILSWTEFMNLHRDVEDDEEDNARKAADDHDEIGVADIKRKAATRLKLDLDLSPTDAEHERLSAPFVYPEWDARSACYLPAHVRVLERVAESDVSANAWKPGAKMNRRIGAVRRQFEALRPKREVIGRQVDGPDIDMDALIRARADLKARGEGSDRVYRQTREQARDLSVAVLVDVSRSTEAAVGERAVIDVEKEALIALIEGLAACGDACAAYAFSSLRRDRVFVPKIKDFDEPASALVQSRIAALRPGFYTRLGGAVRHVSAALSKRPSRKRLLLVLTDGKPNDLDHYDGRHGIEDSRRAVWEARQAGHAVFGITIDSKAQSYFPRIFGCRGYAIVSRPDRLSGALPELYRHLIT